MPIIIDDYAGGKEIKNLGMGDGSVWRQFSKVFMNDGTGNRLIYTNAPEYLYKDGNQFTDATGGWTPINGNAIEEYNWTISTSGLVTLQPTIMKIEGYASQRGGGGMFRTQLVDLSGVKTLIARVVKTSNGYLPDGNIADGNFTYASLCVTQNLNGYPSSGNPAAVFLKKQFGWSASWAVDIEIDVNWVNSGYVFVSAFSTNQSSASFYVPEIRCTSL